MSKIRLGQVEELNSQPQSESYLTLFLRFLRFGLLAWGGPVAQIAMIRRELVEEDKRVTPAHFNRVLAIYQVLPGPEAHELCVYFGWLARGRWGGLLAGLGFMLPGFLLMFALSWFYVRFGIQSPVFAGVFAGFQPAVAGLIVRAIHRIGKHVLANRWLFGIAVFALIAQILGVQFLITLLAAGFAYILIKQHRFAMAMAILVGVLAVAGLFYLQPVAPSVPVHETGLTTNPTAAPHSLIALFWSGLRTGLLTFGGAYTAIPFLQQDAVVRGGWMSNDQFLDGLALSGILPAPLIIFSTFVGYLGGGPAGALVLTLGVFLPAFCFTLFGHAYLERLIQQPRLHTFLDGVTAGVVGLITATAFVLLQTALQSIPQAVIFVLVLTALYIWQAKWSVAVLMLAAGIAGALWFG